MVIKASIKEGKKKIADLEGEKLIAMSQGKETQLVIAGEMTEDTAMAMVASMAVRVVKDFAKGDKGMETLNAITIASAILRKVRGNEEESNH